MDEKPMLVNNLVRMSQGKMMGVDFNGENLGRLEHRAARLMAAH